MHRSSIATTRSYDILIIDKNCDYVSSNCQLLYVCVVYESSSISCLFDVSQSTLENSVVGFFFLLCNEFSKRSTAIKIDRQHPEISSSSHQFMLILWKTTRFIVSHLRPCTQFNVSTQLNFVHY